MAHTTGIQSTQDNIAKTTRDSQQQQTVAAVKDSKPSEKTEFETLKERAVSLEEAREHTLRFINNLPWKK